MTSRWATRTRSAYLGWLELASHEIFHAWNVKRLRPVELGPFDYENEEVTREVCGWSRASPTTTASCSCIAPACRTATSISTRSSNKIDELQTTPGRLVQSAELASHDAWIKYYRPDENSPNTSVSYYTKGAVLGFLLDAKIRKATGGAKSLDDVMRAAYPEVLRRPRLHARRVPRGRRAGRRHEPRDRSGTAARRRHRGARLHRGARDCSGCVFVRLRRAPIAGASGSAPPRATTPAGCVVSQVRRDTARATRPASTWTTRSSPSTTSACAPTSSTARLDQYQAGRQGHAARARRDQLMRLTSHSGPSRRATGVWRSIRGARSVVQQRSLAAAGIGSGPARLSRQRPDSAGSQPPGT